VASVADPLGGSWLVESLTDEVEREAEAVLRRIDDVGHGSMLEGVRSGIESGWFQAQITEAAYRSERELSDGDRVVVGVNRFRGGSDDDPPSSMPLLRIGPDVEEGQRKRLAEAKANRDHGAVTAALSAVSEAAQASDVNVMPALLDAVRARATEGEIVDTLASVFGRWREPSQI
jgi:methylmalonyl-CoA mutase N-terminal domain/subunit